MPEPAAHLLFVCIENSNRSQMAEGFARAIGGERVNAFSAGSRPSGVVNERAIRFMREKGIELDAQSSKGLDDLPALQWDCIVTMGCGDACPYFPGKRYLDWKLADPAGGDLEGIRPIRDEIEALVRALIQEIIPA